MKLSNVLITGASRGLGRALAQELGQRGARLVLCAREREPLEAVVRDLREQGIEAHAVTADIADKRAIHPLAAEAAALVGPIDVLVNNASSLGPTPLRSLLDTECEDLERVLQANLVGPFRLTKVVAGSMALRGGGLCVNISSDAAVEAYPTWGAYGVSKAALDHLTRIFAAELGDFGLRFIAIDPGEMNTVMHRDAIPDADPATLADPSDVAKRIVSLLDHARSGSRLVASGAAA
ncbi:MAG TPA: SDR family oxidoreductase [Polyangiaceae bacterium]|nr:SDR family oxidoreductase [Polyangiaceae bacterium]